MPLPASSPITLPPACYVPVVLILKCFKRPVSLANTVPFPLTFPWLASYALGPSFSIPSSERPFLTTTLARLVHCIPVLASFFCFLCYLSVSNGFFFLCLFYNYKFLEETMSAVFMVVFPAPLHSKYLSTE